MPLLHPHPGPAPTSPPTTAITTTKPPTQPKLGDPCAHDDRYGHLGTCVSPSSTKCWASFTPGSGLGKDGWTAFTTGDKAKDDNSLACTGLACCASWDRKTRMLTCPVPTCTVGQCHDPDTTRCSKGGKDLSVPCGGVPAPHACATGGQFAGAQAQRSVPVRFNADSRQKSPAPSAYFLRKSCGEDGATRPSRRRCATPARPAVPPTHADAPHIHKRAGVLGRATRCCSSRTIVYKADGVFEYVKSWLDLAINLACLDSRALSRLLLPGH